MTHEIDLAEFSDFAACWHDGQSSMLYAVASTGKLSPRNGTLHTLVDLAWALEREIDQVCQAMVDVTWSDFDDADRETAHEFSVRINSWLAENGCLCEVCSDNYC